MKKTLLTGFMALLMAGLAGCSKVTDDKNATTQTINITAVQEDLVDASQTRIVVDPSNGYESSWETDKDESIGLHIDEQKLQNVQLTGRSAEGKSVTFSGPLSKDIPDGSYTAYAYYPYTYLAYGVSTTNSRRAHIQISSKQTPGATTFDPNSVILYSEPFSIDVSGNSVSSEVVGFKYAVSIVKFVLDDIAEATDNEPVTSFKVTMPDERYVAGQGVLDIHTGELSGWEQNTGHMSEAITATFDPAANMVANGVNGIHISLNPISLSAGELVLIEAETENYTIAKAVIVPQRIAFEAGTINTITIKSPIVTPKPEGGLYAFDETLDNEWSINGEKEAILHVRWLANDNELYFSNNATNFFSAYIGVSVFPDRYGQEIDLVLDESKTFTNRWKVYTSLPGEENSYFENFPSSFTSTKMIKGKMMVIKDGSNVTMKITAHFASGLVFKAKYIGEITPV